MKPLLFIILLIGLTQPSCKKSASFGTAPVLDGKWRMIIVKDNISGSVTTKPPSIQGNVEIIFTSSGPTNGTFIGTTPSNQIQPNDYLTGQNQSLSIPNLSMTKVGETSWGNEFVDNIRTSQNYHFENCDRLNIKTTNKTLTFQKL